MNSGVKLPLPAKMAVATVLFAFLLSVPFITDLNYLIHFMIILYVYITLSSSWNIVGGYAGQINLGHAGFFGIGAYTTAALWMSGLTPFIGMVVSGLTASVFAVVISPAFRLRGGYFAIGTLGLNEVLMVLMLNWQATGAASGIRLPLSESPSMTPYYYLSMVIALATVLVAYLAVKSRMGIAFRAIKANEPAAEALGVNPFGYKLLALILSACFTGVAGGFYSYYIRYIVPHNVFNINWTIGPLFSVIIGGPGTIIGPIIGSVIYFGLSEFLVAFAEINLIVLGVILIAIVRFFPRGIAGILARITLRRASP